MNILFFYTNIKQYKGFLSGLWLLLYGLIRIILEGFREPDQQVGYILQLFTMGQILSIPLILIGFILLLYSRKNK
jgi:phosphatidylglycerol:prolipoprotein diacylglycerol transferase